MSEELFLNPEFLKLSRDFVCVPLPLGQHPSGEYFEVLNGLSFVLLDSYGMFLGSVMRPSFETLQNFMKTRLKKAKNLENQRNALFQKTETGEDSSRREALYQLGQFLQQGKAFDQATLSYLKILELLEKDSAPEWKETVLHQMVKMYMDFQASTEMIQLFERYAPSSDYMWLGLGMAHFYKAKKKEAGKEAALEAFQKILNDFPQSSYAPYTQKMIDILKTL
jgi:tetratricopeptide (TPR) repeat protein